MGVSGIDTGGKGGKKPVDAELNLVPFIDLLVCCICFLLITAVWTQMARIEVNQKGKGSAAKKQDDKPPEMQIKITILIGDDGYTVTAGSERFVLAKTGEHYDSEGLRRKLRDIKVANAKKDDVTVAVEDGIAYRHIVKTMDIALSQNFSSIRLSDASAAM